MRTARSLTVSPSMLCKGGGASWGGVSSQRGICASSWGTSASPRQVSSQRGSPVGGSPVLGGQRGAEGLLPGGASSQGGGYPSMHWGRPPPCGQNSWHTLLKILPCPKLRWRAVKIDSSDKYRSIFNFLFWEVGEGSQHDVTEEVFAVNLRDQCKILDWSSQVYFQDLGAFDKLNHLLCCCLSIFCPSLTKTCRSSFDCSWKGSNLYFKPTQILIYFKEPS